MRALIGAVTQNRALLPDAQEIVRHAGDASLSPLLEEAVSLKQDGLEVADELLGGRLLDLLIALAPKAQWFQLGPIVERLTREGDPRSMEVVKATLHRSDEQSRREAAQGVAAAGGSSAAQLLSGLVEDESQEVSIIAIRAIAQYSVPGGAAVLAARLDALDIDNQDFLIAREIIGALARMDDPAATEALKKLAHRKALIKRGHFADIQELARQALDIQSKRGGA